MPLKQLAKYEGIIRGSGLIIPDDFILPNLDYIRDKVASKSGRRNLDGKVYDFARFVYTSTNIIENTPPGFDENLVNCFIITSAASLAEALPNIEPSITCVSNLTGKNRNFIAAYVKALANVHLVNLYRRKQEELIEPTLSGIAYIDIAFMNGAKTARVLEEILGELKSGVADRPIERLEDLEIAFHMAEKAYGKDTLNFKIMEELHQYSTEALVNARKGNIDLALEQITFLIKTLRVMSETRRKARELGLRPAVLEETGEELGKARVFQVK